MYGVPDIGYACLFDKMYMLKYDQFCYWIE